MKKNLARIVYLFLMSIPFTSTAQINSDAATASSFEMYKILTTDNQDNLFFSPYSLTTALAMAYVGSSGKTQLEFEKVMNLSNDKPSNEKTLQGYTKRMKNIKNVELEVSNNMWFDQTINLYSSFEKSAKGLEAAVKSLDFINNKEQARITINEKVKADTKGKIPTILPDGAIDGRTRFVLTNSIYFMGTWDDIFDEDQTNSEDFWVSSDKKQSVKMMNKKRIYNYAAIDDFQILELPYKGKAMSMIIILPNDQMGLTKVERHLNAATFQKWLNKMSKKEVQFAFPKFKMESDINLNNYLMQLGLQDAFTENMANFSKMTQSDIHLSKVFHKSFVEINENGTEASAATAVIGQSKGINLKTPVFKANHPFVYIIKENIGDQILFIGRFSNPSQTKTSFNKPASVANADNDSKFIHVVSGGETLFKIAKQHNVDLNKIRKANRLTEDIIFVGQKLLIDRGYQSKGIKEEVPTEYLFGESKPSGEENLADVSKVKIHKVSKGETLYRISRQYNIDIDDLKSINGLTSNNLILGQELKLAKEENHGFATVPPPSKPELPQPKTQVYIVKKGNTLSHIAKKYNAVSVKDIKEWNNLKSDLIYIGQELKIITP